MITLTIISVLVAPLGTFSAATCERFGKLPSTGVEGSLCRKIKLGRHLPYHVCVDLCATDSKCTGVAVESSTTAFCCLFEINPIPVKHPGSVTVIHRQTTTFSCLLGYREPECTVCADGWQPPGCDSCKVGWQEPNCDSCMEGWQEPNCDSCKRGWQEPDCDTCALGWAQPSCDTCATGFLGDNCDSCVGHLRLPTCDTCDFGFDPTSVCRTCLENTRIDLTSSDGQSRHFTATFGSTDCDVITGNLVVGTTSYPINKGLVNRAENTFSMETLYQGGNLVAGIHSGTFDGANVMTGTVKTPTFNTFRYTYTSN